MRIKLLDIIKSSFRKSKYEEVLSGLRIILET